MNRNRRQSQRDNRFHYESLETRNLLATFAFQDGAWDDPTIWTDGVPDSSDRAVISQGVNVFLSGTDHYAEELVIRGNLTVLESPGIDKSLTTDWIHVNSGGVFQIGTAIDRYDANNFVVTLTGDDPTAVFNIEGGPGALTDNNGFLMVAGGGQLQFFGQEKTSFTKLATTASVGDNFIIVEKQIDRNHDGQISGSDPIIDWRVGDEIVIASSSRDYADEEVRFITSISDVGDGTQVLFLDQPLNNRHYGEIETYSNDSRDYEIDMRAEVAVLNRTIKIQGEASHDTDINFGDRARFNAGVGDGFGGHTMIMASAGQITIDNVQFDQLGQTARLGRYPIHWHIGGDRTGDILRGASVTNSNNRGVTIHATSNVLIQDVVLHDIHGHGFFMENGVETGNLFINNIALGIHKVGRSAAVGDFAPDLNDPFIVDTHDHVGQNANRFLSSAAYWITNPDNVFIGNVSAGSEGTGYWFIFPDFPIGDSAGDPLYAGVRANRTNLRQFDHNSSHSSPIGFNMDRGPDIEVPVGATLDSPFFGRRFLPPSEPQFNHYTAYQHNVGVYQRGDIGNFYENRFADNFTGTFITFTQRITNTLYVGHSRGNSNPNSPVTGHSLYDGANTLTGTHFAGFAASNAHNFRPHGSALRHASHVFSNSSFEDDGSINSVSISTQTGGSNHNGIFQNSASAVYDLDGTLTGDVGGGAGYTIVTNHPFFYDSGDFRPAGWNAWLSDDTYSMLNIRAADSNADFRFTSPDGDSGTWTNTIGQFGFNTHVKNDAGDYVIDFPQGVASVAGGFEVWHHTRVGPSGATVIRFDDIGLTLAPNLPELNDINSLRNSSSSAYYRDGDDLFVKFFNFNNRLDFEPTTIDEDNEPPVAVDDQATTAAGQSVTIDVLSNDNDPDGDQLSLVPVGTIVANVVNDFNSPTPPTGWQYLWNATGQFGNESTYQAMMWDQWRYRPASVNFPYISSTSAHPGDGTSQDPNGVERFAIAAYVVTQDGYYGITNSLLSVNPGTLDGINVKAHVSGGSVVSLNDLVSLEGDFDGSLGFLNAGETIYVGVGSNSTAGADATTWDFSIVRADNPTNGTIALNSNETITYTPDPGFAGVDTFSYSISDGRGGSDTATVAVTVEQGKGSPVAVDDFVTAIGTEPASFNILDNDSDPDGDTLAVVPFGTQTINFRDDFSSQNPATGWQYLWNSTGQFGDEAGYEALVWDSFRYRPALEVAPFFTPTVVVPGAGADQDASGIERYAIAAFTVAQDGVYAIDGSFVDVNSASNDGINVKAHVSGGSVISLENLFTDDGDFDGVIGYLTAGQTIYLGVGANASAGGDSITWDYSIIRADDAPRGTLIFDPDGTVIYTADPGFSGNDTFSYQVSDGNGGRDTATVTVNVAEPAQDIEVLTGKLAFGGDQEIKLSDDSYLQIYSTNVQPVIDSAVAVQFTGYILQPNPNSLSFQFESRVSTPNVEQQIEVYNYNSEQYESVDVRAASFTDDSLEIELTGNLSNYVSSIGEVRARVSWTAVGPVLGFPWSVYVDQATWRFDESGPSPLTGDRPQRTLTPLQRDNGKSGGLEQRDFPSERARTRDNMAGNDRQQKSRSFEAALDLNIDRDQRLKQLRQFDKTVALRNSFSNVKTDAVFELDLEELFLD